MRKIIFLTIILFSFFQLTILSYAIDRGSLKEEEKNKILRPGLKRILTPSLPSSEEEESPKTGPLRRILPRLRKRITQPEVVEPSPEVETTPEEETPSPQEVEETVPAATTLCLPISEVPIEFVRRASDHIERVRGTSGAPGWETAELGETVCPIYRPDIEGIAYYEFEVKPSGYIILSTGEHDFPIPQWSSSGKSVSRKLKDLASSQGKKIEKLYKLDVLAYAAEDGDGEMIASIGTLPLKIVGVNPNLVGSEECPLNEATALPIKAEKGYKVKIEGQPKLTLQFQEWDSWKELKDNFHLNPYYKAVNKHLKNRAIKEWNIRRKIESQPRLMPQGESLRIPLLKKGAKISVRGKGAKFARIRLKERLNLPPVLEITRLKKPPEDQKDVEVTITYTPEPQEAEAPGPTETMAFHIDQAPVTTYYWAGPDNRFDPVQNIILTAEQAAEQDQRDYAQYNITRSYDGKCAKTGCGATAWAMLYGYCDHQAARGDNPFWKPKYWGIYRENGGYNDTDADAPKRMADGIRNIIGEIGKQYLETVAVGYASDDCLSGMTYPRKMQEAFRYLDGRATGPMVGKLYWTTPGSDRKKYRQIAMKRIKYDKMPVMLGQAYHYNMVFGYSETKEGDSTSYEFYINDGHGGDRDWVSASCWLVGYFLPSNGAFTKNDGFAVGDTNGDGKAETIIAGDSSGVVDIFNEVGDKLSSFDGNFTQNDALAVGNVLGEVSGDRIISYPSSFTKNNGLAIGDVNGDGKEEIVMAEDSTGKVELFDDDRCIGVDRGGDNIFYFDGDFTKYDGLAVGDVTGDGKDEILIAGDGSGVVDIFSFNWAAPTRTEKIFSFDGNFTKNDGFAVGDVDGDGKEEILIAGDGSGMVDISIIKRNPDNTYRHGKIGSYDMDFTKNDGFAVKNVIGDRKEEILIAGDGSGRVDIFNLFGEKITSFDGNFTINDGLASGDIDGDGKNEVLIAGDGTGVVDIFNENGDKIGAFDWDFSQNDGFAIGDVNGDGKDEIVIAGDVSGRVDIFKYERAGDRDTKAEILIAGDGTGIVDIFDQSGKKIRSIDADFSKNDGFAVGDVNGDGWDEILVAGDVSGRVDIFNRDGERLGSFDGDFSKNDGFAVGDVLGDNRPEIIIAGDVSGRVDIFDPNGNRISSFDANFTEGDGFTVRNILGNAKAEILIAGDGSGIVDIFTIERDANNNYIAIKLDSYDLYFTENDAFALGDVNGDGINEILIGGDGTGVVDIFNAQGEKIGMI